MRALHTIFGLLLIAGVLLVSGFVLVAYLTMDTGGWHRLVQGMEHQHRMVFYGAIVSVVLCLFFLLSGSRTLTDRDKFLTFDQEGGSVCISIKAIGDYLARLSEEYAAVLMLKPMIKTVDDQLDIEVDLRVRAGAQIPELCQALQQRIRDVIQNDLGVAGVKNVRISVRDIVGISGERSKKANTTAV